MNGNSSSNGVKSANDIEKGEEKAVIDSSNRSGTTDEIEKSYRKYRQAPPPAAPAAANKDKDDASITSSGSSGSGMLKKEASRSRTALTTAMILVLGTATAAAFLAIGITGAVKEQEDQFERAAADTVNKIEDAFEDYVNAAGLVHARCRRRDFSRQDFRDLYEYLIEDQFSKSGGLQFKAVQFYPNTSHAERPAREEDSREFYQQFYPTTVNYRGFVGFNNLNASGGLQPRSEQPWYFPVHYMEPVAGNEAAVDLDYHSSEVRIRAVNALFDNQAPSLSDRLTLVSGPSQVSRCGDHNGPSYGIVLAHPGVSLQRTSDPDGPFSRLDYYNSVYEYGKGNATFPKNDTTPPYDPAHPDVGFVDDVWPRDIAAMVLCIPDILARSTREQARSSTVYIHDHNHPQAEAPVFMGGAIVQGNGPDAKPDISFLDEVALADIESPSQRQNLKRQANVTAANRIWTITVVALEDDYNPNTLFISIGGAIIFAATCLLALWIHTSARRIEKWNAMTTAAQAEKAELILKSAKQQAKTERELNDFLAHEVRNPVAAAMAACNFVTVEVHKETPLQTSSSIDQAREDLKIIDNALHFVNDLLRNMLDMHRAASKQLQVTMVPSDLLHDVMEPVAGMLHRRGSKIKLLMECPPDLFVITDPLRLKQVILNLGRNSSKFIDVGFIRLTALIVDGLVRIHVDDSGCGVPKDKQNSLFNKFQDSLDNLSQGTGIGLFLCKNLVELMGGEIYLDPEYNSGVPGHPGTRFVVDLKAQPIDQPFAVDPNDLGMLTHNSKTGGSTNANGNNNKSDEDTASGTAPSGYELPDKMTVLFVDDDPILRKLFMRTIKTVVPSWSVREAANGETALRLVESGEEFDLIFVDMYMASVEKQLLGTETVAELRNRGNKSRICGLSANDKESAFFEAGANSFMFKPFPCKRDELTEALCQVLYDDRKTGTEGLTIFES